MGYWGYAPYVSVGEKKAKAKQKLDQLKKKSPNIRPVCVEGRTIAHTWWGKSWNANLERYADYSNRIGRGRSYVCNGMVLDLQIVPGQVTALVQGTQADPYEVSIQIAKIQKAHWEKIRAACQGKFDSLPELLEGRFPKALGDIFMAKGEGLFPTPKEIKFSCSCPDWASMCKHVAAALYGIGARLDHDPMLFFALRHADVNALVAHAVQDKTRQLLDKADRKSARVINDANLGDMFGIELDKPIVDFEEKPVKPVQSKPIRRATGKEKTPVLKPVRKTSKPVPKSPRKPAVKAAASAQPSKKGKAPAIQKIKKTAAPVKKPLRKSTGKLNADSQLLPATDVIEKLIRKTRKGLRFDDLAQKSGLDQKKIRNILFRLKKLGRIVTPERGLYRKA